MERWLPVVGFPKYEVSDLGHVKHVTAAKCRRCSLSNWGYPIVTLSGKPSRSRCVHHLVMEAFVGPRPGGLQINHKNGIKTDNRLENLEYITASQNIRHAMAMGLMEKVRGYRKPDTKGYSFIDGRYEAVIQVAGKCVYLGRYDTPEEATAAYRKALAALPEHHRVIKT
jgi:hypothetical protein